uniref:E3 ubiquitin-protein ligase DCST1 isoform X4 n=1 Tax=Scatophagus argus TaxID=75038 RepID=UPI001ED7E824|nr:E3 ubiquitin-protein ligase DCST1 isoform X4 [Scatophagus argus]
MTHLDTPSAPHSTVETVSLTVLPPAIHRFLFSQSEEFQVVHLILRALFGAVSGTVLFLGLSHNLPLTLDLQLIIGGVFVAVCMLGGALSSSSRCSVLLMFPSMLSSRGRAYLMVFLLSVLCRGPVSNIQRNVGTAALSLSCNLDLQVHYSKLLWRDAIRPVIVITQELLDNEAEFQSEALSISRKFQNIRDEVVLQYGYERFKPKQTAATEWNTQQQFTAKTMMQCDSVMEEGVQRCADWFSLRWAECMEVISVPIINHILCVSMRFHFLCDIMRVMTPWCREQIPVEGNFGQLFDQLNLSVNLLSREFSTKLILQEQQQQSVFGGALLDQEFTQAVRGSFQKLTASFEKLLNALQLLLSFTFITIFTQAFSYLRQYRKDVRFDNVYITTYFRQIDARRRRAGKRYLLPMKQSEMRKVIDPWNPRIHPEELRQLTSGVFQVLSVSVLSLILLTVDFSLFHVLDIISRHTFTQFNLTIELHLHSHHRSGFLGNEALSAGSHQVEIKVGGTSMMARLLRRTISAFNSSSSLNIHTDNHMCACLPSPLPAGVYGSCVCCVLLVALFSCLQVYTNRLRRVIAAFYHPQREKKRVLFLYNLQIQRRISSSGGKRVIRWGRRSRTVLECLGRCGQRLCHHHRQEVSDSEGTHYDPG